MLEQEILLAPFWKFVAMNIKMQISLLQTSVMIVLYLITLTTRCTRSNETKPSSALFLCGDQFKSVWSSCCGHQCGVNGFKRNLGVKMSEESAKGFLERTWKRDPFIRNQRTLHAANAVEECCYEGCTIEEVAEYYC